MPLALVLVACSRITNPQGWASPLISGSTLLAEPNHQTLANVDLDNGSRVWTFPPSKSTISLKAIYGTPAIWQQLVFLGGYDGNLYALNLPDGSQKWTESTGGHIVGGPVVSGATVYVGSGDQCLHAFNVGNGDQAFSPFCTGAKIWSTPTLSGNTVFVSSMDKKLYAIDAAAGTLVWPKPFQTNGAIASMPVVESGVVYVGSFDDKFYAVDASTGEEKWSFKADDWIWNRAVVGNGAVYFGSLGGKVYGLDASTGNLRWDKPFQASGVVRGGPALVGSTLVVATDNGSVYGLNATDGTEQWTAQASAGVLSDLTVNSGKVYYSAKNGNVQQVDPTNGTITDVPTSS